VKRILERIIGFLKNNPSYKLDDGYTLRQLFFIVWYRGFQLVRGLFLKIRVSSKGLIFCGAKVIVHHAYQVNAGKSLIIEEGVYINALSEKGIVFGNNVTIAKYAILNCTGVIAKKGVGIEIADGSAIGAQSFLGGQGGIKIGKDVIIGPQVKIFSENHNYSRGDLIIRAQGESRVGVEICNNCWIGSGVTILDGVKISSGCVVAAGAVVTKSMPENSLVAGVPAKVIKSRIRSENN
jgi:acetyltransferase-like isoleucine patch superfamily enzyme